MSMTEISCKFDIQVQCNQQDEGELATEGDDGRELPETSVDFLSLDPLLVAVNIRFTWSQAYLKA